MAIIKNLLTTIRARLASKPTYLAASYRETYEIIHDIRSPLAAVKSGITGVNDYLPKLLEVYKEAVDKHLIASEIQPRHLEALTYTTKHLEKGAYLINFYINVLEQILKNAESKKEHHEEISIKQCLEEVYQFYSARFNALNLDIRYHSTFVDFNCWGNRQLILYTLVTVLKEIIPNPKMGYHLTLFSYRKPDANVLLIRVDGLNKDGNNSQNSRATPTLDSAKSMMQQFGISLSAHLTEDCYIEYTLAFPAQQLRL